MAVYDNKAADELARAKCWHRAWREWVYFSKAEGKTSLATLLAYPLIFGEPDGNVLAKENQWVAVPNLPVGGD